MPKKRTKPKRKRKDPATAESSKLGDHLRRVRRVDELLASQRTTRDIALTIAAEYDVSERRAYLDIAAAYERMKEDDSKERGDRKDRIRLSWQEQYRRCLELADMSAANYALDRLTKLDGLYEPDRLEVKNDLSVMLGALVMTPIQRQQRIVEIRKNLLEAAATPASNEAKADADDD